MKYIPKAARENYLRQMIRRFSYIKWSGVIVVAVTGIIQWIEIYPGVIHKTYYLLAFAIKMTGAIGLFIITFLLSLPESKIKTIQKDRAFWSAVNIFMAIIILTGAAFMRFIRTSL